MRSSQSCRWHRQFCDYKIHIELDENGNDQNQKITGEISGRVGCRIFSKEDLASSSAMMRIMAETEEPGEIFDSSVPIRMVRVCFLSAHLKSDQSNDRRTGIRQVVECVRSDGDGMADHTGDDL